MVDSQALIQNVDHVYAVAASPRTLMPQASARELAAAGEIEKGFSKEDADRESRRCLQCGLICYEHTQIQPAVVQQAVQ